MTFLTLCCCSSGCSDIGLHKDIYDGILVTTYLTIICGCKLVLMLPPTAKAREVYEHYKEKAFPYPTIDTGLLKSVEELGGFSFILRPPRDYEEFVTLLIPRGWYHWLLNVSSWTVVFSGSQYPVQETVAADELSTAHPSPSLRH